MPDFFAILAARAIGTFTPIEPRRPSLFEPELRVAWPPPTRDPEPGQDGDDLTPSSSHSSRSKPSTPKTSLPTILQEHPKAMNLTAAARPRAARAELGALASPSPPGDDPAPSAKGSSSRTPEPRPDKDRPDARSRNPLSEPVRPRVDGHVSLRQPLLTPPTPRPTPLIPHAASASAEIANPKSPSGPAELAKVRADGSSPLEPPPRRTQDSSPPRITISIGRLEVRSTVAPAPARTPEQHRPEPRLGLDEYLRRRRAVQS